MPNKITIISDCYGPEVTAAADAIRAAGFDVDIPNLAKFDGDAGSPRALAATLDDICSDQTLAVYVVAPDGRVGETACAAIGCAYGADLPIATSDGMAMPLAALVVRKENPAAFVASVKAATEMAPIIDLMSKIVSCCRNDSGR